MKGLAIGQTASDTRTFTEQDLAEYAALAAKSSQSDIVPGPLLGGMFSCLLGTRLPGRGTNWLKQKFAFPAPAHVGEEITATVEIIRLRPEKDLVNLRTVCANPAGVIVCEGEALVLVKDLE
jgi:3-hydroxybutyryl-CoA dehydratase